MQVPSKYSICKFLVDSWLVFNFFSLILLDSFKSLWLNLLLIPDIFHQNCRFPQSVFFAGSLTGLVSSLRITTLITLLIIYLAKNIKERSDTQSMNIIAKLSTSQPANLQLSCGEPTYMWLQPRHVYMWLQLQHIWLQLQKSTKSLYNWFFL